ncbi:MAG: hypothetical protein JWM72_643 [Actinomycetia bacterium]|jgi:hypothetical protein|nr:hypothetical protein [Actinomycetes bacterium]
MARGPLATVDVVGAFVGAGLVVVEELLAAGFDDDEHAAIVRAQERMTASLRIKRA